MRFALLLPFFFISILGQAQYTLIWSDEFDTGTLDGSKWSSSIGGWGWGNNELQYYTAGDNLSFSNDELVIEAREEQFNSNAYTSGKIITKNLFEVRYGKVEARIKFPSGQGLWPAFWMLGANIDQVSWPFCGEIDVMEHVNNEQEIHGTAHWQDVNYAYYGGSQSIDVSQYHIYTVEWDSAIINWYVDGTQFHAMSIANGVNGTSEFHGPFYLLLNLAVGGNWPGSPNASTNFPATLHVDYVRVYKTDFQMNVEETEIKRLSLYPNPTNDQVQLTVGSDQSLQVFSTDGALVLEKKLFRGENQIDLSSLDTGLYLFIATSADGVRSSSKIMVR
jgi:beta-glucanase (GH16 family)